MLAEQFNVNMRLERDGVAHDSLGTFIWAQHSLVHAVFRHEDRAFPKRWGARI